jgi:hypothetical protein
MALFTDGTISTLEDLLGYESAILDAANSERIDLSKKLILAQQELEVELTDFLLQHSTQDPSAVATPRPDLGKVVVTLSLRQWHTFHTLALAYRDAYNSHFNDRYRGKWKEYDRLARWASRKSFDTGIGMVYEPLAKASSPILDLVPGSLTGATYWMRVAWTSTAGEEGCPSEPGVLALPDGSRPAVEAGDAPTHASGWNVYAGLSVDEALLQNESPLAVGASWEMPDSGLQQGRKAGEGQTPAYFLTMARILRRG